MSKYDCITICVVTAVVGLLLAILSITIPLRDSIDGLTKVLSQPGITDRVEIEHVVVTSPDGVVLDITGLDVNINSRIVDVISSIIILQR